MTKRTKPGNGTTRSPHGTLRAALTEGEGAALAHLHGCDPHEAHRGLIAALVGDLDGTSGQLADLTGRYAETDGDMAATETLLAVARAWLSDTNTGDGEEPPTRG